MSAFVPAQITYAAAVVRNARESRINNGDRQHAALMDCIEAQQRAIVELGRMVAELQTDAAAPKTEEDAVDVPAFLAHRIEVMTAPRHGSYWKREEAYAANDVQLPLCIHGEPRNVFCGKCES